ncbi:tyrosine-type recombinase/integrase [Mesorhizobium sp. M2A.F.Ca.ET.067.02.1.1]|uniref:tyrosine-type recombinase/integrase n=1 Tax=Mesorhizobium sp. M2A.F.Ca.ET.067.02.1.1 TaxID=2496749 RepID=UPI000FD59483|nr:tyrosine-type recombinase/integrase [Mesorhizobium sp. M2A.F.Ca.ET.067.02.1.1]RUW67831.1 integrase [Mesorhizobium sp. M2A.F.Ca.ET.067.02.1.1]TIU53117.1 MAG: integrase [Mesorhizobium sp.]
MRDLRTLGPWLRRFLADYIVTERSLARNTQMSYRDSFTLLLPFISTKVRKPADRLNVEDITSALVLQFLAHLEENRSCSAQTRNQRLTAIRSFARFVASRDPAYLAWCAQIRAITTKKAAPQPISWMSRVEMEALLAVPDRRTLRGRAEHALLLFLYNTGARVSEATRLQVGDLQISRHRDNHALVTLHGKGNKIRQCPLWPRTEDTLSELIRGRETCEPVFLSRHRKRYTRFGVYRLVERCAAQVPSLAARPITPHVVRHTCACHLLQAGVDLNTIRAWLGHVSLETTNIYAEIDIEMKAKAMALCSAAAPRPERPWKEDKGVMAFLNSI